MFYLYFNIYSNSTLCGVKYFLKLKIYLINLKIKCKVIDYWVYDMVQES